MFADIKNILGPREGLMVDEENDAPAVSKYFTDTGVITPSYGNGISLPLTMIFGPNIRPSIERACALRAETGFPKFICVWTVNTEQLKREYMRIGVDGIISDDLDELQKISTETEFHSLIRLATSDDNPFGASTNKYSLEIHTSIKPMAGTDANLSFVIKGTNGQSGGNCQFCFTCKNGTQSYKLCYYAQRGSGRIDFFDC